MFDKMKQLMELKKQAEKIKHDLDALIVESCVIDGITININGTQKFQTIDLDSKMLTPENKGKLESDLLISINAAVKKAQDLATEKMKDVLPGFPGMT